MEFNPLIKFRLDVFSNKLYLGRDVCLMRRPIASASLSFVMLEDVNTQRSSSCFFWHDPRSLFIALSLYGWTSFLFYFILNFILLLLFLLYNIVFVLPYINMNPPWVYMCSPSWNHSHLPPQPIPLGRPSAPAPSIQKLLLNWATSIQLELAKEIKSFYYA